MKFLVRRSPCLHRGHDVRKIFRNRSIKDDQISARCFTSATGGSAHAFRRALRRACRSGQRPGRRVPLLWRRPDARVRRRCSRRGAWLRGTKARGDPSGATRQRTEQPKTRPSTAWPRVRRRDASRCRTATPIRGWFGLLGPGLPACVLVRSARAARGANRRELRDRGRDRSRRLARAQWPGSVSRSGSRGGERRGRRVNRDFAELLSEAIDIESWA
jgi:hypothetical protein